MELRRYLAVLLRRWPILVLTTIVAVGIAWTTTDRTPRYTATSTLFVGTRDFEVEGPRNDLQNDTFLALDRISRTFSLLIESRVVTSDAVQRAGVGRSPDSLAAATAADPVPLSQLLAVSVTDRDPGVAQTLSIALSESFVDRVGSLDSVGLSGAESEDDVLPSGIPVVIFERAGLPTTPEGNGLLSRVIVFATFGLVVSAAAVFAVNYLDVTLKGPEDTEKALNVAVLAVIPMLTGELSLAGTVRTELAHVGDGDGAARGNGAAGEEVAG